MKEEEEARLQDAAATVIRTPSRSPRPVVFTPPTLGREDNGGREERGGGG